MNMQRAMKQLEIKQLKGEKNTMSDLVSVGLNMKARKPKKVRPKQPPGVLPNGEFRDLNDYEINFLKNELISLRIKRWILRSKKKHLMRENKKFLLDEIEIKHQIEDQQKKLFLKCTSGYVDVRNNSKEQEDGGKIENEEMDMLFKPVGYDTDVVLDKGEGEWEKEGFSKFLACGQNVINRPMSHSDFGICHKTLKFDVRNPKDSGGGGNPANLNKSNFQNKKKILQITKIQKKRVEESETKSNDSGHGKGKKYKRPDNLRELEFVRKNDLENSETQRDLISEVKDDESRGKQSSKSSRNLFGFIKKGINKIIGIGKVMSPKKATNKDFKSMHSIHQKELEDLKKKNIMMYKNEDQLKFKNTCWDYISFCLPSFFSQSSKRDLFENVRK
jgi:hypothetical protein